MLRRNVSLFSTLIFSVASTSVFAANDCCWDWSPQQAGRYDGTGGGPKNQSNSAYAVCTATSSKDAGGNVNNGLCFTRGGRQMVWKGWHCVSQPNGTPGPDGFPLPANTDAHGWFCVPKGGGAQAAQKKLNLSGDLPGPQFGNPDLAFEGFAPAVSTVGLLLLVAVVAIAGAWMFRKYRVNPAVN